MSSSIFDSNICSNQIKMTKIQVLQSLLTNVNKIILTTDMCILFIYSDPNPPVGGYRLIVASNRDEFYKRPAEPLYNCTKTNIIGGRDMEPGREGGMWLGLSLKPQLIKFGCLLSVTGEKTDPSALGRGPLVYNYLNCEKSAAEYINDLKSTNFSPFNLLTMELTKEKCLLYHHSNAPLATHEYHGKQILGFSNSTPDEPFTKVKNGTKKFEKIVRGVTNKEGLISELLEFLKWGDPHLPDLELEKRAPKWMEFLSSIFVKIESGGYGTRTHSIVLVGDDGKVEFLEETLREPIDAHDPQWEVRVVRSRVNF